MVTPILLLVVIELMNLRFLALPLAQNSLAALHSGLLIPAQLLLCLRIR